MRKSDHAVIRRIVFIILAGIVVLVGLYIPSKTAAGETPGPDPPQETLPPPGDTLSPDTTFNSGSPPGDSMDSGIITIILEAIF